MRLSCSSLSVTAPFTVLTVEGGSREVMSSKPPEKVAAAGVGFSFCQSLLKDSFQYGLI